MRIRAYSWLIMAMPVAFVMILAGGCANPADDVEKASVGDAVEEDTGGSQEADAEDDNGGEGEGDGSGAESDTVAYELADSTYIGFAGSKVTGGTHYGQFNKFEGTVEIPNGDITQAKIDVTIDTTSMDTDNSILTNVMKGENFFRVEEHPEMTFKSTKIEKKEDENQYQVTGNLTIRGMSKSISFPVEITLEEGELTAYTEFAVDRHNWDVGVGWTQSAMRDEAIITLDVVAEAATPESGEADQAA